MPFLRFQDCVSTTSSRCRQRVVNNSDFAAEQDWWHSHHQHASMKTRLFMWQFLRLQDDTDQTIVDGLLDGEGKMTSEIAAVIGLTSRATRTRLARLVGNGLVCEAGSGTQDPTRCYFLSK